MDFLHLCILIFQATDVLLSCILIARVFLPLPCSVVSLFSVSWQIGLLFFMGYLNCISIIQLCIIFQWTWVLDWQSNRVIAVGTVYAGVFASIGIACDLFLVSKHRGKSYYNPYFQFLGSEKNDHAVIQDGDLSNFLVDALNENIGTCNNHRYNE